MTISEFLELVRSRYIPFAHRWGENLSDDENLSLIIEGITPENYRIIEKVYTWYPCRFSKEQIADLYLNEGMRIFCDMQDTAELFRQRDKLCRILLQRIAFLSEISDILNKGIAIAVRERRRAETLLENMYKKGVE